MATRMARPGQWLVVANASGGMTGDRGDLVAVCDDEDAAYLQGKRSGYHARVLSYGVAGKIRTPRGCEVVYDDAATETR